MQLIPLIIIHFRLSEADGTLFTYALPVAILISMSNAFALGKWIRGGAVEEIPAIDALVNQAHPVVYISPQVRDRPNFLPTGSYVIAANKQAMEKHLASEVPLPSEIAALATEMEASILGEHTFIICLHTQSLIHSILVS
jgi:hypothetical protein